MLCTDSAYKVKAKSSAKKEKKEKKEEKEEKKEKKEKKAKKDKGKGKDGDAESTTSKKEEPAKPAEEKKGAGKNLVGRINNLVSSDLNSLDWASMHIVFASAFSLLCFTTSQTELTCWTR